MQLAAPSQATHPSASTSSLARTLLITAAALTLTACGGGGGGYSAGGNSSSSTSTASASSSTSPSSSATGGAGKGTPVMVSETEFKIALDRTSFTPGTYTFMVADKGQFPHALSIDGPGVENKATATLREGQSGSVTVTFKKGTYELYCPVDAHKAKGMDMHITVK